MKRITLLLLVLCLASAGAWAQGGILGRLGREVRRSTERAVENAVDRAVDKAVDKAVNDAVDKAIDQAAEKASEESGVEVEANRPDKAKEAPAAEPAADGTWNCPKCGAKGNSGRFCDDCGAKDPSIQAAEEEVAEAYKPGVHSTWFCNDVGTVLGYEQTDADGKTSNTCRYVITDWSRKGGKTVISYDMYTMVSEKPIPCSIWAADGWFHMDAAGQMGQMGEDLKLSGHAPVLPDNPQIGTKLKDCTVKIENLATTSDYTDIRFTKHEKLTTPAGTFDCWCLEYTNNTKMAFIKTVTTTEQWMAKDVGVVKTVTKDKKGKVQSVMELISIEKSK
ncbi:MAG: hypothetical protein J5737_07095 [Bacteroidales bacterium]|nr:hypothetical protein [Bacteroidales bacterium]